MLRKVLLPLIFLQLAAALYAKDQTWIDFGELPPGYIPQEGQPYVRQYDPAPIQEDDTTIVDFSSVYDPSEISSDRDMRLSLALDRWQVKLSGSSNFHSTKTSTMVRAYKIKDTSKRFSGENLMAVHFELPILPVNSKIWIMPEFNIPAYSIVAGEDRLADSQKPAMERMGQFLGKGVLRNVGPIRYITATVYGRRFPLTFTVEAENTNEGSVKYPMGSLQFSGWQDLVWKNSNYITDVRKRKYNNTPEYPRAMPSLILRSLRLDRPVKAVNDLSSQVVFYIKKITAVYDEAVSEEFDKQIDDEMIWQLNTAAAEKNNYDNARTLSELLDDRYDELKRRHDYPGQETLVGGATPAANNPAPAADDNAAQQEEAAAN